MQDKQALLLRILCLFWLISRIISYKIWFIGNRLYPVVPPFEFLDGLSAAVHAALYFTSLLCLVLLFLFPHKKALLTGSLILLLLSCLPDVMRWQPWEYQYLFFLVIIGMNRKNPAALYSAIVFVLGAIYIYSGVHKFNGGFLYSVWDNMILREIFGLTEAAVANPKLHYAGLALPVIETFAGILLLVLKNKKIPAALLIAMHVLIIIMIIIVQTDRNRIILPWNMAMILFLFFFYYKENFRFSMPVLLLKGNIIIAVAWGILPALYFVGYWDKKLSSSMYSGKSKYMDICINNPEAVPQLKPYFVKVDPHHCCKNKVRLPLNLWASQEVNLLPYPEYWYYIKFKKKWEKMYPNADAEFKVYSYPFKKNVVLE